MRRRPEPRTSWSRRTLLRMLLCVPRLLWSNRTRSLRHRLSNPQPSRSTTCEPRSTRSLTRSTTRPTWTRPRSTCARSRSEPSSRSSSSHLLRTCHGPSLLLRRMTWRSTPDRLTRWDLHHPGTLRHTAHHLTMHRGLVMHRNDLRDRLIPHGLNMRMRITLLLLLHHLRLLRLLRHETLSRYSTTIRMMRDHISDRTRRISLSLLHLLRMLRHSSGRRRKSCTSGCGDGHTAHCSTSTVTVVGVLRRIGLRRSRGGWGRRNNGSLRGLDSDTYRHSQQCTARKSQSDTLTPT